MTKQNSKMNDEFAFCMIKTERKRSSKAGTGLLRCKYAACGIARLLFAALQTCSKFNFI
jgi:hypothetical protein